MVYMKPNLLVKHLRAHLMEPKVQKVAAPRLRKMTHGHLYSSAKPDELRQLKKTRNLKRMKTTHHEERQKSM